MPGKATSTIRRRWIRALSGFGLLCAILLIALYLLGPRLVSMVAKQFAKSEGIELKEFAIDRPGISSLRIPHIKGSAEQFTWALTNIRVEYHWRELLEGQLQSVNIEALSVSIDEAPPAKSKTTSTNQSAPLATPEKLAPEYWLQRLPWRAFKIEKIMMDLPASQITLSGGLEQYRSDINFYSHIKNSKLNLEHDLSLEYSQSKGLEIDVLRSGPSAEETSPVLSVTSQFHSDSLDLSMQVALANDDARELAAILGRPDLKLDLSGTAETTLPWPLPNGFGWEQLHATGAFNLSVFAANPGAIEPQPIGSPKDLQLTNLAGEFALRNRSLELRIKGGQFSIAQQGTSSTATCGLKNAVSATLSQFQWAVGDGLNCELRGQDQIEISLKELLYTAGQNSGRKNPGAGSPRELAVQLSYNGIFSPLGKPLTANGELTLNIRQSGADQIAGTGTLGLQSPLLRLANGGTTIPTRSTAPPMVQLPFNFDYWPQQLRGKARFEHNIKLGPRVLTKVLENWQDGIDVGDATLKYTGEVDWDNSSYHVQLAGDFLHANIFNPASAPAETSTSTLQFQPLSGSYKLDLEDNSVTAEGALIFAGAELPYSLKYTPETGVGELSSSYSLSLTDGVFSSLFQNWNKAYDLTAGQLQGELLISIAEESLAQSSASATLTNASFSYEDYVFTGIAGIFQLEMTPDLLIVSSPKLRANALDIGFPVSAMEAALHYEDKAHAQRLRLTDVTANLLGGEASATAIEMNVANLTAQFNTQLNNLSLKEILALEGDDIKGSGVIQGTLPIQIVSGDVQVLDGKLSSVPPGGDIKLSEDFTGLTGQPGLDFALQALNDFSYDSLQADVSYEPNGDLELGVALQGSNPAIEQGRRIHYNVTVSENVLALLESLKADQLITNKVEQRMNQP